MLSILTFISIINLTPESLESRFLSLYFQHSSFYEQLKFHAQLSEWFYNLRARSLLQYCLSYAIEWHLEMQTKDTFQNT